MSYENLNALGLKDIENIDYYTVRTELDQDVLKVYYQKDKASFFHRSEKFKFHRSSRTVPSGAGASNTEMSEISPHLVKVMSELDQVTKHHRTEKDIKQKVLEDLRHLEKVVSAKVAQIEADLEKL